MSALDINVRLQYAASPRFSFEAADPGAPTAAYLKPNGDIHVPANSGALTIRFHLKTTSVNLPGHGEVPVRFDLGLQGPGHGKRVLKIWEGEDKTTTKWPAAFNGPAIGNQSMTVSTSNANRAQGTYHYRLALGARTGHSIKEIEVDPIIKNGGTQNRFLDWLMHHPLVGIGIVVVVAVIIVLLARLP